MNNSHFGCFPGLWKYLTKWGSFYPGWCCIMKAILFTSLITKRKKALQINNESSKYLSGKHSRHIQLFHLGLFSREFFFAFWFGYVWFNWVQNDKYRKTNSLWPLIMCHKVYSDRHSEFSNNLQSLWTLFSGFQIRFFPIKDTKYVPIISTLYGSDADQMRTRHKGKISLVLAHPVFQNRNIIVLKTLRSRLCSGS